MSEIDVPGSAYQNPHRRQLLIAAVVALVAIVVIAGFIVWLDRDPAKTPVEQPPAEKSAESPSEVKLSPDALKAAAIEIEGITQRPAVALLKVTGTVETNPQQTQQTTMLVSGRVESVNVVIGDRVRAGALLAVVSSPEVAEMHGKLREAETRLQLAERNLARVQRAENRVAVMQAKAKLDEADATLKRTRRLIELGVGAGKDLISAEASYTAAKAEYDFQSNISLNREVQQAQAEVETARVDAGHIRQSLVTLGAHLTEGERDNPKENISRVNVRHGTPG
jgi:multidrug efflux pump subunit AcrA (membrane-fusion protein)